MTGNLYIQNVPSIHFEPRPAGAAVETIIIHTMHNPECLAAGEHFELSKCKECLDELKLSAHYLIGRDGEVWNLVPEEMKAWHAGESTLPHNHKSGVNAFSIGIELIGTEDSELTTAQYDSLAELCLDIASRHPITSIYGHSDIAPSRKTDPWNFNWMILQERFSQKGLKSAFLLPLKAREQDKT